MQVGSVSFERQGIADHAADLVANIAGNLGRSLEAIGVDILLGSGKFLDAHTVEYRKPGRVDVGGTVTAANIIIATGSVPFVPPGIEIDGKTVITSDHALKLEWLPQWVAIIGSGYIGLEFSDVYTALGSEVTFVEAMPNIMPGFDAEIAKMVCAHTPVSSQHSKKLFSSVVGVRQLRLARLMVPASLSHQWIPDLEGLQQRSLCGCHVR